MLSVKCKEKKHIYLNIKCWDITHFLFIIISMIFLLFVISYSILLSIYYHKVGTIKIINSQTRVNTNYEFFTNIISIIIYFLAFFLFYYTDEDETIYKIGNYIIICVFSLILLIHSYNYVLYYNKIINYFVIYSWAFIFWFNVSLILKHYLDISDIILFVLICWIVLIIILYFLGEYKIEYYLTEANVLEAKTIKEIEIFTYQLLLIVSDNSMKAKTLLTGLLQSLKDFFQNNPELYEKYEKFEQIK
jgi:hypothetical protein